jgi:uncharacterized protein YdiU (UPF0061 family)
VEFIKNVHSTSTGIFCHYELNKVWFNFTLCTFLSKQAKTTQCRLMRHHRSSPFLLVFLSVQLTSSGVSDEERKAAMNLVNPKYVLRNYLCQSAIDAAEQGDFEEVRRLLKLMEWPYDEQPGMEKYARLPPAWAYRPGVGMLSCSS